MARAQLRWVRLLLLVGVLVGVASVTTNATPAVAAQGRADDDAVMRLVRERVEREGRYARLPPECQFYLVQGGKDDYVVVELRRNNGGACGGDPLFAPLLERFRVFPATGRVERQDQLRPDNVYVRYDPVSPTERSALPGGGGRITFARGGDIYVTDGGMERRVAIGQSPVFSPDGTRVAFVSPPTPSSARIRSVALDGSDPRDHCVTDGGRGITTDLLRWSPRGRYIAYMHAQGIPLGEVHLCDTATGAISPSLRAGTREVRQVFDWTPDGENAIWEGGTFDGNGPLDYRLYYGDPDRRADATPVSDTDRYRYRAPLQATEIIAVRAARIANSGRTIAVVGDKIAFVSVPGQRSDIDGKVLDIRDVRAVAWSPDGIYLAVSVGNRYDENSHIDLVNVVDGTVTRLADGATLGDWSRQ